jgi:hypothetical protein
MPEIDEVLAERTSPQEIHQDARRLPPGLHERQSTSLSARLTPDITGGAVTGHALALLDLLWLGLAAEDQDP